MLLRDIYLAGSRSKLRVGDVSTIVLNTRDKNNSGNFEHDM